MKLRFLGSAAIAVALAISLSLAISTPASAQLAVIDVKNVAAATLQAARLLQQINNQIRALQNQAAMLQNMGRNLTSLNFSSLSGITNDLQQIGNLMNLAQGITFDVQSVDAAFSRQFPRTYGASVPMPQLLTDAQTRWQTARSAFQQTMLVQSQIAQTVQADTGKIADLVNSSQGAVGSLQAQQAANQLLALSIKQQLQVQTLLAAQGRAEALKDASEAEADLEGKAALQTFLGSSNAYTPR
jgi:P-type conjugative transfer protein TrbJ